MSREMNNMISRMVKYDLILGFIFVLIVSLSFNLKVASIFFLGLMVSLINTIANGLIIEYSFKNNKQTLLAISYLFRITIIILIALPFLNNLIQLLAYILGYVSHLLFVVFYWMKKGKGSD